MNLKELSRDQLADLFRQGQAAAEKLARLDEQHRLVQAYEAIQRDSGEALRTRVRLEEDAKAAQEQMKRTEEELTRLQERREELERTALR